MAFVAGKNSYLNVDNSAGSPTDISAYCANVSLSRSLADLATTTLGAGSVTRIAGLADGSFQASGPWDATCDGYLAGVFAATIAGTVASTTFAIGPAGSGNGKVKITGECVMASYDVSTTVDGRVEWSATFNLTGAVTVTTF